MPGRIQEEIQQSTPVPSLEEEAFLNVVRTADGLLRSVERLFRPHGLTGTQYNVLRILRGAGQRGATCGEIGERLINSEPDITRLLDRMEKRGLVSRCRDTKDRRQVTTRITPAGLDLVGALDAPIEAFHRQRFAAFSPAELQQLIAALERARSAAVVGQ